MRSTRVSRKKPSSKLTGLGNSVLGNQETENSLFNGGFVSNVRIENPILNSPYEEPKKHFRFSDEGITDEIVLGRRSSSYFVPIAKPKKKNSKELYFDTEWTKDRIEENKLVNDIRSRIAMWRQDGYLGVTPTTARLLTLLD